MPQWFVSFEPSTRARNLHGFCKEQNVSYTKMLPRCFIVCVTILIVSQVPSLRVCDVFRRIKKTAKDKLVDLLAHRWQLATVTAWA